MSREPQAALDPTRPLAGVVVLVTRTAHQASALAEPLEGLGATVLVAPVIAIIDPPDPRPMDEALIALHRYDWIVLTSVNAVDRFLGRANTLGVSLRQLAGLRIAVVGSGTAERLREAGLEADVMPEDYRAEGLLEALGAAGVGAGSRVLVPRAEEAREILPDSLRARGVIVDVVPAYRTVPATPVPATLEALAAGAVQVVTFTSPSTVRHFIAWLEMGGLAVSSVMATAVAASIGPITTSALVEQGIPAVIEAVPSTVTELVDAIVAHFNMRQIGTKS